MLLLLRYASEGIQAACQWAYKGVSENSVLGGKAIRVFVYVLIFGI